MAAHWPRQPADDPIAAHLNATPKYVVTKTLTEPDWPGSHVLDGDVADTVQELKAQGDGTIAVLGSGILVQTLIEYDLVDEYWLFVHQLVLGSGKRLFRQTPRPLRCASLTAPDHHRRSAAQLRAGMTRLRRMAGAVSVDASAVSTDESRRCRRSV